MKLRENLQQPLFVALSLIMSSHFAMTFARTLTPSFHSLQEFGWGHVDIAYRPRVGMQWVYRLAYYVTHDQPPRFAHGAMSATEVTLYVITFVSLLLIIFFTRAIIRRVTGRRSAVEWMSLLAVTMCCYTYLLTPQVRAQFPYDLPAVAVFATAIYAILTQRRWLYYPVLLLGSFNRETTLFLPPLFILLALDPDVPFAEALRCMSIWRYTEAAAQLVAWFAIVHWCNVHTNAVLGPTWAVPQNIHFLLQPMHWPTFLSVYGFLWIPFALWFRNIGHVNLQRCAVLLPLWFAAMFWKADLLELRVQGEWVPYLTVCLALIARNMLLLRKIVVPGDTVALPGTDLL